MTLSLFWHILPNNGPLGLSPRNVVCLSGILEVFPQSSAIFSLRHCIHFLCFPPSVTLANSNLGLKVYYKFLVFSEGFPQCPKQCEGFSTKLSLTRTAIGFLAVVCPTGIWVSHLLLFFWSNLTYNSSLGRWRLNAWITLPTTGYA